MVTQLEKDIDAILQYPHWRKITTAKVPTWVVQGGTEGLEIVGGKLRSFWVIDGERNYDEAPSIVINNIIQQIQPKEQKTEQQPERSEGDREENHYLLMPERLTDSLIEKFDKLSFPAKLMLFQNTDPKYIKEKPGRAGAKYSYVDGHYMHQVLNLVSGFTWESHVDGWKETETEVICWGHISVHGVSKGAVGQADIKFRKDNGKHLCLGDDYKAAQTDMEKKAASKFGIAIDVYRGEA